MLPTSSRVTRTMSLGVRILSRFRPCVPEHPADDRIIFGPKLMGPSGIRTTEVCLAEELLYLLYLAESNF